MIVFARYEKRRKIKEEFLFSNTLLGRKIAADVKALLNPIFEANELSWQNFKHICTDNTSAMIGVKLRVVTVVKNEWPRVMSSHCLLYRHTLASKTLFDGSGGRCGQSDPLYLFQGKKITGSSNFWLKKWECNMWDFCFTP